MIGHEYGHHLQYHYFYQNVGGHHYVNRNDIWSYLNNYNGEITSSVLSDAKYYGSKLALKEAWPTFFAISAESTFSSDIKTVPTVDDYI